ncbi:MAG: HAD family hydrolase [Brooklawnia sp.]|uniref:HAD family hydrolase n=1 Tax=Brooklawnia sp. TaxID=2699740 RepID=UPI003C719499
MQADTVIFDMDGTLTDSMDFLAEGIREVASRLAGREFSAEDASDRFGPPDFDVIAAMIERPLTVADEQLYLDHLKAQTLTAVPPIAGVSQMLGQLQESGLRLGIYTARALRPALVILAEMGLVDYFSTVVAGDLVAEPKPAPDGLIAAMQQMGADPARTVYVGDTAHDLQLAQAAGVRSALVLWARNPRRQLIGQSDVHFDDVAVFTDWVLGR